MDLGCPAHEVWCGNVVIRGKWGPAWRRAKSVELMLAGGSAGDDS